MPDFCVYGHKLRMHCLFFQTTLHFHQKQNNRSLVVGEGKYDLNQINGLVKFSKRFTHFLQLAIDDNSNFFYILYWTPHVVMREPQAITILYHFHGYYLNLNFSNIIIYSGLFYGWEDYTSVCVITSYDN